MSDPAQALSRVLGHGSAHEGAHHWRVQRVTAVALGVLVPWLLISLATLIGLLLSVFLHLLLAAAGVLAVLRVALTAQP